MESLSAYLRFVHVFTWTLPLLNEIINSKRSTPIFVKLFHFYSIPFPIFSYIRSMVCIHLPIKRIELFFRLVKYIYIYIKQNAYGHMYKCLSSMHFNRIKKLFWFLFFKLIVLNQNSKEKEETNFVQFILFLINN